MAGQKLKQHIVINISQQTLVVYDADDQVVFETTVSTAKNGAGERVDSECTPRGQHVVRARIGEGCAVNTVFVGRRPTGEIYDPQMRQAQPERDWILTRILWLSGKEPGKNRLGNVDTMRRYIYIHGCPDEDVIGIPSSHGCIKLHNQDMMRLFDLIETGTNVLIEE